MLCEMTYKTSAGYRGIMLILNVKKIEAYKKGMKGI